MKKVMRKMKNIKSIFAALICIALSVIGFSSCDWSFLNGGVATFASLEDEEDDVFNERQIPQEEFFYVKVDDARSARRGDKFDYLMYARHEGPGVACKIPVSQESSEDLYCMLDVLEGDLLFQDITLEYNVPENMCDYVEFKLPWHYNQRVGRGPSRIISFTNDDGTIYSESTFSLDHCEEGGFRCPDGEDPVADSESPIFNCDGEDIPVCLYVDNDKIEPTCPGSLELNCNGEKVQCGSGEETGTATCDNGGTPACSKSNEFYCDTGEPPGPPAGIVTSDNIRFACEAHDLDLEDAGLSNCCFGKYTEINYDKEGKRTEKKDEEWGTNFGACIGGMARINIIDEAQNNQDSGRKGTVISSYHNLELENVPYPYVHGRDEHIRENGYDDTYKMYKIYSYVGVNEYVGYSDYRKYKSAGSASCWGDEDGPEGCETEDRNWPDAMYENNGELLISSLEGHPFFTWSCLDHGLEVKHRIHLIVREWNTEDEFNAYKESNGSRGTANKNNEQDGCSAYESDNWINYESECNDLSDVDDLGNNYPEVGYGSNLPLP